MAILPWLLFALVSFLWWICCRPSIDSLGLCSLRVMSAERQICFAYGIATCAFSRVQSRVLFTCWSEFWDWGGAREDRPFGRRAWGHPWAHLPLSLIVFVSKIQVHRAARPCLPVGSGTRDWYLFPSRWASQNETCHRRTWCRRQNAAHFLRQAEDRDWGERMELPASGFEKLGFFVWSFKSWRLHVLVKGVVVWMPGKPGELQASVGNVVTVLWPRPFLAVCRAFRVGFDA